MTSRRQAKLDADVSRLEELPPAGLRRAWEEQENTTPPRVGTALLRRLLAQRLQERRLGGTPVMVLRELSRVAGSGGATGAASPPPRALTPGARLIREWQGRTIAVSVTENGFIREERTYQSLSQIAREVTGAHWSGPRFFGLTRRG